MKFFKIAAVLFFSICVKAEIQIVEVANGKAVIKFDKEDNITTESKLVLKDLTLGTIISSTTSATQLVCPACPQAESPKPETTNVREYQRTHLITGSISSTKTEETAKGNSTVESESSLVEIEGSYYYNLKNFALGFSLANTKKEVDGDEMYSNVFSIGGRFFPIENIVKNRAIPYVGLQIVAAKAAWEDTPDIEADLSGSLLEFGLQLFMTESAFIDISYTTGAVDGDLSQGANSADYEIEKSGLSFGIGLALE